MRIANRILLLFTSLLAAWQVAIGIEGAETLPMIAYTIGFGVLLVASLLLLILGLDVLESPAVVIVSTIIPLCLSLGLIWEQYPALRIGYLIFSILGFLAVMLTRITKSKPILPVIILAIVHGIAGLVIFLVPIISALTGATKAGFAFFGLGGALIGIGGLLLSFLRAGKPLLTKDLILKILPGLLLLTTAAFVAGFHWK